MIRVLLVLSLFIPIAGHAVTAVTVGGYVACKTKQQIIDMAEFAGSGSRKAFNRYIRDKKCVVMGGGHTVLVTEMPGVFGGHGQFMIDGVRLWTIRPGLSEFRTGGLTDR